VAILKEWTDRRARHDEVRRVLELVGLADVSKKRIRQLSGGMRRRVGIAQAMLGAPDLLLLDEPTAGLDPEQRLRFRELLGSAARDATVLLSTHQTDDVAALCQHVVVMLGGGIRFSGPPAELAALAQGQVWTAVDRDPAAGLAWVTSEGRWRHVGTPPEGAELVQATVEDGYLQLASAAALSEMGA
jgi:ABC-2 type transport system ATP-binding protein